MADSQRCKAEVRKQELDALLFLPPSLSLSACDLNSPYSINQLAKRYKNNHGLLSKLYLRISEEFVEFNVAGGALRLEIRKYISEQQSGHIQRDRGGVASVQRLWGEKRGGGNFQCERAALFAYTSTVAVYNGAAQVARWLAQSPPPRFPNGHFTHGRLRHFKPSATPLHLIMKPCERWDWRQLWEQVHHWCKSQCQFNYKLMGRKNGATWPEQSSSVLVTF